MNTTPKKIDIDIQALIEDLGLDDASVQILKLRRQAEFEAVEKYCNINCIKKQELDGGSVQFGWVIWQDKAARFTEAEFHAVWVDENGQFHDITPRIDKEKRIMFVPDNTRKQELIKDTKGVRTRSYTNHKMQNGVIVKPSTDWEAYMEPDKLARIGAKL
ncbi:hypothetical protein [Dasania marina]|uniref:hypothetical protein n=1 Tax=Dasania marina TaxID=471499 RepID=UPI0003809675|nr:hypothetical protein [Dasania marina]